MHPKILLHADGVLLEGGIFLCSDAAAIIINQKVINGYFKNRGRRPPLIAGDSGLFYVQLGRFLLLSFARTSPSVMIFIDHQLVSFDQLEPYLGSIHITDGDIPGLLENFKIAKLNYHHFIDDFEILSTAKFGSEGRNLTQWVQNLK